LLRAADIATVNLEGAISERGVAAANKQYHFRGGPALLRGAAHVAGIDLVTVANNHSLDFGRDAFLDTLSAAHDAGLKTVGGGATIDQARRPAMLEAGGLRIAVLGYSDVRPYGFDAGPDWAGTAPADPYAIAADVAARRRADLVVVWFHWGVELATSPNGQQQALADAALAAGASVVLGAHPHVLQPITRRGHKLVAWSLGNFVFPSGRPQTTSTGVLLASLDAHGVTGFRLARATIHGFRPELDAPVASGTDA
jgi:poly-gamma-glutamate capsule biosynthesis protein CapA/YwtB (metallophosphatase superfamily)